MILIPILMPIHIPKYMIAIISQVFIYVTGFGKSYIVHTSNFVHLKIHKHCKEWCTDLKFSAVIKETVCHP